MKPTTFEKRHDAVITEVFESKEALNKHESECQMYQQEWECFLHKLYTTLRRKCPFDEVYIRKFEFGSFCPHLQTFTIDYVKPKDWANGISDNSIFLTFWVDMRDKTIEVRSWGHIWLTDADAKKSYLCMCGMKDAHKAVGGKWFRKKTYKSHKDAAEAAVKFVLDVYATLLKVTDGYPYKQMTTNIYSK